MPGLQCDAGENVKTERRGVGRESKGKERVRKGRLRPDWKVELRLIKALKSKVDLQGGATTPAKLELRASACMVASYEVFDAASTKVIDFDAPLVASCRLVVDYCVHRHAAQGCKCGHLNGRSKCKKES